MAREVGIVDLLKHDAERRQKRKADAETVKAHIEQSQMQTSQASSAKSQDMVYQRFIREQDQVFQHHEIDKENAEAQIDFPTMLEIIGELGFIKGTGAQSEVDLCTQMWHHIGGNEKQSDNVMV